MVEIVGVDPDPAVTQMLSGDSGVMKILLAWCLVSVVGTLLALRLIRNGKRQDSSAQLDDTSCPEADTPSAAPGINKSPGLLPESSIARHPTEHLQ